MKRWIFSIGLVLLSVLAIGQSRFHFPNSAHLSAGGGDTCTSNSLVDGDFPDGTNWSESGTSAWTISGGQATFDDSESADLLQAVGNMADPIHVNTVYEYSFDLILGTATSCNFSFRRDDQTVLADFSGLSSSGSYSGVCTQTPGYGGDDGFIIAASSSSNGSFSITNICIEAR